MKSAPWQPGSASNTVLAGAVLVLGLGALSYLGTIGWQALFPQPHHEAHMQSGCDLRAAPCSAQFPDGGLVTLAISPRPPTPNKPVRLTVEVDGRDVSDASVTLRGETMNMGELTLPLRDLGHGMFSGNTSLPICTRRSMTWVAEVVCHAEIGTYRARFTFDMASR